MNRSVKYSAVFWCVLGIGCAHEVGDRNTNALEERAETTGETRLGAKEHRNSEDARMLYDKPSKLPVGANSAKAQSSSNTSVPTTQIEQSGVGRQAQAYSAEASPLIASPTPPLPYYGPEKDRENYRHREANAVTLVAETPVSTFSIDVDTGAYTNARRFLRSGALPHHNSVRVEEFVNYFSYHYPAPDNRTEPFTLTTEMGPSPWSKGKQLLQVGLRGYAVEAEQLPSSNLVFLVDVSGSMNQPTKLPLLKTSLNLLTRQLTKDDSVSIVVYAGAAGVVLEPTPGDDTQKISAALNRLRAGGSTNGEAGIHLAYSIARSAFIHNGINRIILATDGDFNVGTANVDELKNLVERRRKSGISLTTLGFGTGNYNDALMNELAEIGNGNAAYIDTALEARKVLVEEVSGTLFTIAKDVKIQIEFSPLVKEYRLVGYESRVLNREDFNNDAKDAGEIGAGHTVTAMYELVLEGSESASIDPLRYSHPTPVHKPQRHTNEVAYLKLRYKLPNESKSRLLEQPVLINDSKAKLNRTSDNFRFAAAVAAFAELLRGADFIGEFSYQNIHELAKSALGPDPHGYRNEFLGLVKMADTIQLALGDLPEPAGQGNQVH